jgi:hypothetical protein
LNGFLDSRFDNGADIIGNSLGTAGTRRTVYLVDENPKISSDSTGDSSKTPQKSTTPPVSGATGQTPVNTSTPIKGDNAPAAAAGQSPSTFLMYNKISTVIEGGESSNTNNNGGQHPSQAAGAAASTSSAGDDKTSKDNKKKPDAKKRDSAIWYEYGCV